MSTLALVSFLTMVALGQGTTSILSGSVHDESGAVIKGAQVVAKNLASGVEFKTMTAANGTFSIPALDSGTYSVTVSATGFKVAVLSDVKLDAGTTGTVRVPLEVGSTSESVIVQGAGEIVQTQSANIATTLSVNQISNLPLVSRDTLNFVVMLPGVDTPGINRDSTIHGLPQTAINITLDGINVQDNYLKTSDGFFSRISPRLDAVDEVTVSTATPGAESGGQGAVQIKFVTRRGNNEFHGSIYEYHRNPWLNSNYWFNNRDLPALHDDTGLQCGVGATPFDADKCHAARDRVLLNQYGFRVGGPFLFPKKVFGPTGFDGRNRAFFFVNYEEFRLPSQITRNRTVLNTAARNGIFTYSTTGGIRTVDLLDLARRNGQVATVDPTISNLLLDIENSSKLGGAVTNIGDVLTNRHTFTNNSIAKRYFPTVRLDFNLSNAHHLEGVYNYQKFDSSPDILNSRDPAFPGFPNQGGQISNRYSTSIALRSTLSPSLVNEARFGFSGGPTLFNPTASLDQFTDSIANQDGFNLNLNGALAITNATVINTPSRRNPVLWDISDSVTWTKGSHSWTFGGEFTRVNLFLQNQTIAPTIGFGTNSNDPANAMFVQANFQNASGTDITRAGNLYGVLTGRVISITGNALLSEDTNTYKYLGDRNQRGRQTEYGFYAQDQWRVRPSLTLNYGLRWEVQLPFTPMNDSYTTTTVAGLFGISGEGNMFKPGVTPGTVTQFTQFKTGERAYNVDYRNFAPSFGFAWSPSFSNGWLRKIAGDGGQTVFRGGYSIAYNRNGIADYSDIYAINPGSFVNADRSLTIGNLVTNNNQLPVLFRNKSLLGPGAFPSTPNYPITGAVTDGANIIDPNIRIPYSQSWTFGIQREISKNTAIEVRYVGTRNLKGWSDYNFNSNEQNLYETGMLNEFKLAQANLQANIAANRGNTFRYFGPGTGTSPLPITLAYFSGLNAAQALVASNYTSTLFTSTTFTNQLAIPQPLPLTYAANLHSDQTRRANAIKAGLAPNFFLTNPDLRGGVALTSNSGYTRYTQCRSSCEGVFRVASSWARIMSGPSHSSHRAFRSEFHGTTI